jgi:hypothetical protein
MVAAGIIIVRQQDYVGVAQILTVFVPPFVGPAGAGGRGKSKAANIVAVFFTFRDVDDGAGSYRFHQFWQPVEHSVNTIDVPGPLAILNRAPLPEVFRLVSHDLKLEHPIFIDVVIGRRNGL